MNILVIGATGLIGSHVRKALLSAGHRVTGASRKQPQGCDDWIELEFSEMDQANNWLPHLAGVDGVVNCVGIIREVRPGDFDLLHRAVPVALFEACEQVGIHRVIQISALGSAVEAITPYWRSKGAAEADLLSRSFGTIVRPSLVYGTDGASSRVFRLLATLPLLAMPEAKSAKVQPIHVDELSEAIVLLLAMPHSQREMAVVGPRAMSMAEYLGALRSGMHAPAGLVIDLPRPVAKLVAAIGKYIPTSALTPDSLAMLIKSSDGSNTADAGTVTALLGRPLRDPSTFATPELRPNAVMGWAAPALRISVALLWLITASVSWFGWPHAESHAWLAACGIPAAWRETVLLAASLTDAAIACALLVSSASWLWLVQLLLVSAYTLIMSVCLPQFWLHPFGILSKNLPLLMLMFVMWRLSARRA